MRAILPLFASLMLMLTVWTVAAHAAEPAFGTIAAGALAGDHGDADDDDRALIHQHGGCHGHFLAVARTPVFVERPALADAAPLVTAGPLRISGAPPPHLRPPQA